MKQLLTFLLLALIVSCQQQPKLVEWRGPQRTGIYRETNLLKNWPENGPEIIWETEAVGNGYASPIVTDESVFVTGEIDSLGYLFKFDKKGNERWRVEYGPEWTTNFPGSRGTPTLYGKQIYICSGKGMISCMDTESGKLIWQKNMIDEFHGISPRFGYSQALVVDDDKVFCMPGGTEFNFVALNRLDGELIWSSKCFGERPGYNSAKLIEWAGKKTLVTFSAYHLLGINAETGELQWSHEQTNTKPEERQPGKGDTHGNTALFENGYIYYAAGDGNRGVKLKLSDDGTSIEKEWTNANFDGYMGGILCINSKIYGSGTRKPSLKSIDIDTWELTDSLKIGTGTLVAADQMLYYYNSKGEVHLVNPHENGMEDVSSFKLEKGTKEHFSHPVIKNGALYIRHGNYLGVYNIKQNN